MHRCLQRHGISRLPEVTDKPPKKSKFKQYPIGYFHIDITQVRTEEGKLYLFVAIDRTSKFAFAELHERMTRTIAAEFLRRLIAAVPYKIHTILTDNGVQFTNQPHQKYAFKHLFDRICSAHGIEHRLTKPNHPWTNGQVERMNRTLKDATVYRYLLRHPSATSRAFTDVYDGLQPGQATQDSRWVSPLMSTSVSSGRSNPIYFYRIRSITLWDCTPMSSP